MANLMTRPVRAVSVASGEKTQLINSRKPTAARKICCPRGSCFGSKEPAITCTQRKKPATQIADSTPPRSSANWKKAAADSAAISQYGLSRVCHARWLSGFITQRTGGVPAIAARTAAAICSMASPVK